MKLHPVQQGVVRDRASVGGPQAQCFAVLLAGPSTRTSSAVMDAKGTSSTPSTSICAGPTGYRPPSLTLGRRHRRNDTVMSPDSTAPRSSRLNSTC